MLTRCSWCTADPLLIAYHDKEWGVPVHDDRALFEMLLLEGAQAGLSWLTILHKRDNYRLAFSEFHAESIARYGPKEKDRLLGDPGIVRNRLKIEAAVKNAQGVIKIQKQYGSLDAFLWRFVDNIPIQNHWQNISEIPAQTRESILMSKELKQYGFNFVGPTICYSFMQAVGMVNDHTIDCFRYRHIKTLKLQETSS